MTTQDKHTRYSLVGISIKNFRGLKDVDIDFTDEVGPRRKFVITGPQGSGKSTLIDAIQFCGYGLRGSGRFTSQKILPMSWVGKPLEDQSVSIRLRPFGPTSTENDEIRCERVRKAGSESRKTEISVWIGSQEETDRTAVKSHFSQLFGDPPKFDEGAMWSIRTEEMNMVADSLSDENTSYFLEFMNLNIPSKVLTQLVSMWGRWKNEKQASARNFSILQQRLQDQETKINNRKEGIRTLDNKCEEATKWMRTNSLTDKEKRSVQEAEDQRRIIREFKDSKTDLTSKQITRPELSDLIHTLLSSLLTSKGFEIPKSYDSSSINWNEVADYCAKTNKFTKENISDLRSFGIGIGIDTSHLNRANKKIGEWQERIDDLQKTSLDNKDKKAKADILEEQGIDLDSIVVSETKQKNLEEKKKEILEWKKQMQGLQTKLKEDEIDLAKIRSQAQSSKDAKKEERRALNYETIASSIHRAIENTDNQYKKQMYEETLESIIQYWKRIDQQNKYEPILDNGEFFLRDDEGNQRKISRQSETGEASDGESELFLVCCCLALAEKSGSKMPIVLDDCFTKVDKPTRKKLIEVVSDSFDSMIFVTNDEDKAALMEDHSSGHLVLSPFKFHVDKNSKTIDNWMKWVNK